MNTKRPIREFFEQHFPQYRFVPELRPNLIFRQSQASGIYRCISIQRDSEYCGHCGLTTDIAATYDPNWRGGSAMPTGNCRSLAELRAGKTCLEVEKYWIKYKPTPDGLHQALSTILNEFCELSPAFFEQAEQRLLSNRLLQTALAESRLIPLEMRIGLVEASAAVKHSVGRIEHPAFLKLRDAIRAEWTPDVSKEERRWTSRLAYDCLTLTADSTTRP